MLEEPKLIKTVVPKVVARSKNRTLRGLCQSCYSSNVEISLCKGQAVCDNCKNPKKSKLSEIWDNIRDLEESTK